MKMKVLVSFLVLVAAVCAVLENFETCTEVEDCSEIVKTKCDEMSKLVKESGGEHKLALACKNGICMCNVEFAEITINKQSSCKIEEKEKEERKQENVEQES